MKHALGGAPGARTIKGTGQQKRRGATLLVSIAILTLLSVFAIAFVQLVNFERHASANYVDAVRARMAARAGVQRAISELQRIATRKHYSDARPVGDGGDGWAFRYVAPESIPGGNSFGRELSLLTTMAPSFAMSIDPAQNDRRLFGVPLAHSGSLSSSYGNNSIDAYKLKVIDSASQLNLNHPDRLSIERMLKNLLRCASELDAAWPDLSEGEATTLARAVMDARPPTGFKSLSEVHTVLRQDLLGAGNAKNVVAGARDRWLYADATGNLRLPLRDMLTVSSWVDDRVIRPWALNFNPAATPEPILGRRDLPLQPRAPINLNTASVPVLTAALAELRGAGRFGSFSLSYLSGKALAQSIRTRVMASTGGGPFRTWLEFERWLDGSPFAGRPGTSWAPVLGPNRDQHELGYQDLDGSRSKGPNEPDTVLAAGASPIKTAISGPRFQGIRDLVKAALNPNTMINKFGAQSTHGGSVHGNFSLPRLIDKSDLTRHGTEGCFDSMGVYEITSLGMVLVQNEREPTSPGMQILAVQTQQVIVHIYNVMRLSTQADFETNRALMATGDFIEAFDRKWTYTAPGVNRPRFGPPLGESVPRSTGPWGFEGWPGVTSYPVYSLHRDDQNTNYAMRPQYGAADWDGYLALSNLLAIPVQPMDFVVCFARGYLDAFKVRTWWEPKDQDPANGQPKVDPTNPSQTVPATRGHDPQNGFTDLQALAAPKGRVPMLGGHKSSEPNPLDAVAYGADAETNNPRFFYEGSALTPHGAMIHPNRSQPGSPNQPCALVYDGDNIDLMNGTSIRFWVMPTDDPYVQPNEVLFSFIGSRDGKKREVGFWVEKEYDPILDTVAIYLRWRSDDTVPGGDRLADGNWGGPLGNRLETSIDVTPNKAGAAPNPSEPEWVPGSWHWVVVNFGPQTLHANAGQSATLQVDKKIMSSLSTMINMGVIQSGNPSGIYYGEVHAQNGGGTFPAQSWWGSGERANNFGDGMYGSACTAWRTDRMLGDWYHCDMGGTVDVENQSETYVDGIVWDPNAGGGGGTGGGGTPSGGYVVNSSVPANPFPDGSYDRQLVLDFIDKSDGESDHQANMVPANGTGMGDTGWTYTFTTTDMGADGKGGTADDFQINIIAKWKLSSITGGKCTCCSDCGTHDETNKRYYGRNTNNAGAACRMKYKAPPPTDQYAPGIGHGGLQGFVAPDPLPMQYICDQCHGCEACDVDGPMFFGGQPAGDNYDASGNIAEVNPATVARAVFDNIIIKNNKERRTDTVGAKNFEDRFFESSLAMASALNDLNFGAVYRRGLLELQGFRARLGTLSWTSYPSTDNSVDFLPSLYRMDGGTVPPPSPGSPTFSADSPGFLNTRLAGPATGEAYDLVNGRPIGWRFGQEPTLDTTAAITSPPASEPYPREILVLSVELSRLLTSSNAAVAATQRQTLLPQPLVETPVFEDVTLTLLLESPQIIYAEEGVEE